MNNIVLDGNSYRILSTGNKPAYKHIRKPIADYDRGGTGMPLVTETGWFENTYEVTLLASTVDLAALEASYNKRLTTGTPSQDNLALTDPEGFIWDPNTGVNDATHAYSTGVFFTDKGEPQPLTGRGGWTGNLFTIAIKLLVNATS